MGRKSISQIKAHKETGIPLVCLTAYTTPMAASLDAHCDILLVGDSLGTVLYGMDNTTGVTLDMMINHGKAVANTAKKACIVVDLPYGTYEDSPRQAYSAARRAMDETGCDAVKLEGGVDMEAQISHIVEQGIPVMGHIGLQPQSVIKDGGYKIKGKNEDSITQLIADAKAVEDSGAFAVVIEGTIDTVATTITQSISIPTIGIGASAECDGQILVTEDMVGFTAGHIPKFAKQYAQIGFQIEQAAHQYANEVRARSFPSDDYIYKKKT